MLDIVSRRHPWTGKIGMIKEFRSGKEMLMVCDEGSIKRSFGASLTGNHGQIKRIPLNFSHSLLCSRYLTGSSVTSPVTYLSGDLALAEHSEPFEAPEMKKRRSGQFPHIPHYLSILFTFERCRELSSG